MTQRPDCILPPPRAILFDWDGTLVDSFDLLQTAHNQVLKVLGLPDRKGPWFTPYFGRPRDEVYLNIYGPRTGEAVGHFETFMRTEALSLLKPVAGAVAFLSALHDRGVPMGIVSNKKPEFLQAEIEHLGWKPYFRAVIGAGMARQDKPAPDPIFLALETGGLDPAAADVWYIGDTAADMLSAQAAGCTSVLLGAGGCEASDLATCHSQNYRDLQDYLLQSRGK